jgi:hypothetical protein
MDWSDLAGKVVGLGAPMLGGALGGPLGAAAGKILADALGSTIGTPEAVNDALSVQGDSDAGAAALIAEANWLAALAEVGKAQVAEIGATQRAEIASNDPLQRWWRPIYALELSAIECPALMATLLHTLWTGQDAAINGFVSLSGLLIAYFTARFGVLGVYVTGRTREKQATITGELQPSVLGELVKTLVKKK